jgi:hypothetical protein
MEGRTKPGQSVPTFVSSRKGEVKMISHLFKSLVIPVFALSASLAFAQAPTTESAQTAKGDPPAAEDARTNSPAATKPEIQPTVEQMMKAMQNQIDELKAEVKAQRAAMLADSNDTAALKAAEKALVAGVGTTDVASAGGASGALQPASQAPSAAAPAAAPPEISAQVTTKGEPFDGDWTWLNSNGHQIDSPMATKYFTPEFRADANYTIDYNHPKDDTLGGSTETFRSDEWQLEQISVGGDIRIHNVRGRILSMDGLFATTTPRNDGSVSRGNWDLVGAYKYVSEAWGGYHWDVQHGVKYTMVL